VRIAYQKLTMVFSKKQFPKALWCFLHHNTKHTMVLFENIPVFPEAGLIIRVFFKVVSSYGTTLPIDDSNNFFLNKK